MAKKKKSEKIDWLADWKETFYWSGQTEKQIHASKHQIEEFVRAYLKALDHGLKITEPEFGGHTIEFAWFAGPDSEFLVSAYLTPPATETGPPGGSGLPQLSPTPPPKP